MAGQDQLVYHSYGIEEDYDIDSKKNLGEGGFGQVCRAIHKATKAERACKRIRKKDVKDKKAFEREVDLQKALDHPNICRLYDVYQDNKTYYLCLEICKGGELFDRILEAQHFGEDTVGHLAKQMIGGLHYMHHHNFAHRDLKPENYLLARDLPVTETPLKLIDFGMSRKFEPGQPMKTRVVTPFYVSPEVLGGTYTEKCDIWSLGVIFYIMFCGSPPFYSNHEGKRGDEDIFKKVKAGKYSFDPSDWKHVSKQAQKFVSDCLQLDHTKRPSAEGLLEHPWVVEHIPKMTPVPLSASAISTLKAFRQKNKLQKIALNMIAHFVDDEKVEDLHMMFETMDADKSGTLEIREIKTGLENAGLPDLANDIAGVMKEIDNDGSGAVDYREFIAATMSKKVALTHDYVWQVFKQFDTDHTGTINKDNLATILNSGQVTKFSQVVGLQKSEIEELMSKYDTDKNGVLDFDEFMALLQEGRDSIRLSQKDRTKK
jgi:calcium-dependent protein kinase